MKKDYSMLRPFDLEAAKAGAAICFDDGRELWDYVAGPDSAGHLCLRIKCTGEFSDVCNCHASYFRMAPLAWVRVSADDPTLRPVYKGDVLYYNGAQVVASRTDTDGDGDTFLYFQGGGDIWISGPWGGCESVVSWTPPKVKREGWVNVYGYIRPAHIYPSSQEADMGATQGNGEIDPQRIACIRIEWEE